MREIRMSGLTRERAALGFAHAPSLLYWLLALGCGYSPRWVIDIL